MATIIKTWAASVELHKTAAYGGTDAILLADQAFDYTANVDLATAGNQGAQVDLSFRGSNQTDALVVEVFASNDGTVFDTIPTKSYILKTDGTPQHFSFLVLDLAHFRIGVKSRDTNTSFEYMINQRIWILTNA